MHRDTVVKQQDWAAQYSTVGTHWSQLKQDSFSKLPAPQTHWLAGNCSRQPCHGPLPELHPSPCGLSQAVFSREENVCCKAVFNWYRALLTPVALESHRCLFSGTYLAEWSWSIGPERNSLGFQMAVSGFNSLL